MLTTLLTLTLVFGADPTTALPMSPKIKMPKLMDAPAPLKPLSSQVPLIRPVLSFSAPSSQSSLNLPSFPKPNLDLRVKECERKPEVCSSLAEALGQHHSFLVVEDLFGHTIHAAGLQKNCGLSPSSWKMVIRDHSADVPRSCKPLPSVDPLCVISKTPYNQRIPGRYVPFFNDCNTFTQRTINACQMPNLSASSLLNPKPATVWDKFSLLKKPDTVWDRFSLRAKPNAATTYPKRNVDLPKSATPKAKSR